MFGQKIGNSVSDRLFRDSMIAENQCLYYCVTWNFQCFLCYREMENR